MRDKWWAAVARMGVVWLVALCLASCSCEKKQAPTAAAPTADRQWVCEACDHTFLAPPAKGVQQCPKCGKAAAVRSMTYKCGQCGKYFEAYRFLDCTGLAAPKGPDGKPVAPGLYLKQKGGQWVTDEEMLGERKCPHCGNADESRMAPGVPPPPSGT